MDRFNKVIHLELQRHQIDLTVSWRRKDQVPNREMTIDKTYFCADLNTNPVDHTDRDL